MLRDLDISNILLIERLTLEFQPGLNVLTGETGAGKSILLDCLGFVLGWRGRAEVVRAGAPGGEVTAVFDLTPDHPANHVLQEAGFAPGDELVLRRVATPDGRKRAFVNDRRASGEVLRALSDVLVELHGQGDDRGLLNPRNHRAMLDLYMDDQAQLDQVRQAWRAANTARSALDQALEEQALAARDAEFVSHSVKELNDLDPQPGEADQLDSTRRLMQSAERIREDIQKAAQAVGVNAAQGDVSDAMRWLETVADRAEGGLDEPLAALSRALAELSEAERGIDDMLQSIGADPAELERVEDRLFAIRGLARKHDVQPDDLSEFADELRRRLDSIENSEGLIAKLTTARDDATGIYERRAEALTAKRQKAARQLDAAITRELAPLKMERAHFATRITPGTPGPTGTDEVVFEAATNPGAPAGPISKIASGGELSRFLLAMKVCLAAQGQATMIFDEIDRGVGGATADAVGRRLSALAADGQIIAVTHSPQVAALARHHWQVAKSVAGDVTRTDVRPLDKSARTDEIARMLSGENVTEAARDAALALLDGG